MATKCKTCNEEILSSEFIKCGGICSDSFHSKCVGVNKTLLNALGGNPNIRWFCHDCNSNNSNIASSIKEMKDSFGQLSGSLSSDLSRFFKSMSEMTECVVNSLKSISGSNIYNNGSDHVNPLKRRREDSHESIPIALRRTYSQSLNMGNNSPTSIQTSSLNNATVSRKSIVVSNIAPDIDIKDLSKFLVSKLNLTEDDIRITSLMPRSLKPEEINYMQYRVSVPVSSYDAIKSNSIWPVGVRIRDFVFKQNTNSLRPSPVAKNQFIIASDPDSQPIIQETHDIKTSDAQDVDQPIENLDFLEVPTTPNVDANMD